MTLGISPDALESLLQGKSTFALIDVREAGEFNSSHIPRSSLIPRRELEFRMAEAVPFKGTPVIVCDDDGRRARLAATTLEGIGYAQVSMLDGGINAWVTQGHSTEWGLNVLSKDFGERIQVEHEVSEISATELHDLIQSDAKLVILDTRTPEEYQRFCIPGGASVPGGEIALRITDITRDLDPDTTVIVNCAGRTRSIIGTRMLQRMGLKNVHGLQNGTSGWVLAGLELESGADRLDLPEPSSEGLAAAEAYAERLADQDGVRYLNLTTLQDVMDRRKLEPIYLIDVRTREEYEQGHIPGFRWFPGGQAVQRSDEVAVVHNSTIVFCCDGKARATFTASWYRQLGYENVYAVDGGTSAWKDSRRALEKGLVEPETLGLAQATSKVTTVSPQTLAQDQSATVIFVDTSQDFANGHVPGANWVSRSWLELRIADFAPDKTSPVVVTCQNGVGSTLAGATLADLGYTSVSVLDGGMDAWAYSGLPVEKGLSGVMTAPNDIVPAGPDRGYADMMNYLRWEEALGVKYESH